jgi:hypothetical protein
VVEIRIPTVIEPKVKICIELEKLAIISMISVIYSPFKLF